ncbi:MAG: MerR family transcriptional regulator [Acidobacteria bacterium]|nr:MerR family transcriptional regulator [Acidobacteriota bacterium]
MEFVPKKLYYKIGEVCEIVGVPAHVLRFWETEFPALAPPKSRSGQRTYRPRDIELLLEIRRLLYDEGFTIAGARKRLGARPASPPQETPAARPAPAKERAPKGPDAPPVREEKPGAASDRLERVQSELRNILTLLDRE